MSNNQQIVMDFIKTVNTNDMDKIMMFFSPDCFYHNIPLDPITGTEEIRNILTTMFDMSTEVEWTIHNVAETAEGHVMTERTDAFMINGKWIKLPVMGIFELQNSKITSWRDYFDANQIAQQLIPNS